jgi:hypothetical protein
MEYKSYIKFGEEHTDERNGLKGYPLATSIYKYGCERVTLEWEKDGGMHSWHVDAPRISQDPEASTFKSKIVLGEEYKDTYTGIYGIVDAITFHEFGSENPTLIYKDAKGQAQELYLDAGRLEPLSRVAKQAAKQVAEKADQPGGPARGSSHIRTSPTRR